MTCSTQEPTVDLTVNGRSYTCLVDSGFGILVETAPGARKSQERAEVTGIEGNMEERPFLENCTVQLEGKFNTRHPFLFTPRCPVNLLGRDLLCKHRAQVNFEPNEIKIVVPVQQMFQIGEKIQRPHTTIDLPKDIIENVHPQVWDIQHPRKVVPLIPIEIKIKRGVRMPRIRQRQKD